jgi:hypothetical protein
MDYARPVRKRSAQAANGRSGATQLLRLKVVDNTLRRPKVEYSSAGTDVSGVQLKSGEAGLGDSGIDRLSVDFGAGFVNNNNRQPPIRDAGIVA